MVKADTAFARLAMLSPGFIDVYLWRARVYNLLDENDEAPKGLKLPFYQQHLDSAEVRVAKQVQPAPSVKSMVEAYNHIAGFALYKEDKDKAKLYWDKSITLDPQDAVASEGLKSLTAVKKKNSIAHKSQVIRKSKCTYNSYNFIIC